MSPNLTVKVHPGVLFGIVDSHERRNEGASRVIGTLLGVVEKGAVEVTNSFCVPHNESEDEVAVDMVYAKEMYDLHKKVNPNEAIVGWYATGPDVTAHSVLIHDFYSREVSNPVHLTVDTSLTDGQMKYRAYTSSPIGVPGMNQGTMFSPCKVELAYTEAELVGAKVCQDTKYTSFKGVKCIPDLDNIYEATKKTQEMIKITLGYIDDILAGVTPPDNSIGRMLMDLVQSVPQMDSDDFHQMFNSNMNDLLMVIYLSQLAKANLTLHEHLSFNLDKN